MKGNGWVKNNFNKKINVIRDLMLLFFFLGNQDVICQYNDVIQFLLHMYSPNEWQSFHFQFG